jgi:hypothetical protein
MTHKRCMHLPCPMLGRAVETDRDTCIFCERTLDDRPIKVGSVDLSDIDADPVILRNVRSTP